ncbi:MAG: DUF2924 domain-containing protein [Leptolyngbya sp. PLA3]|nr:MAG: DUF2924 domain-containing protein [Cyanobacteria bacterium CYA]MCE7968137.1 DUF2924 domain-containing protein [Leptolyngbya sp. PL-A3]
MARHLVLKHLENVSGELLAQHGDLLSHYAKGKCGIYVLYAKGRMYYVGLASNLSGRVNSHLKDRHKGNWDRFSIYLTRNDAHMRELEALLHRVLRPEGNRQLGRLVGSEDLRRPLQAELRSRHQESLRDLMGERLRIRVSQERKVRRGANGRPAAGLVERTVTLRAVYKGEEYKARLLPSGTIRHDGRAYDSPSAAAEAIRKKPTNGWTFWRMEDSRGEWSRLSDFRGQIA